MTTASISLDELARAARTASRRLAQLPRASKDKALLRLADLLDESQDEVLAANAQDMEAARRDGIPDFFQDRLLITPERLRGMAADVRGVAALPDPVGEEFDQRVLPNGMSAARRRVPLGVVGAIYESRPNVTVDIASLCLKSGNACILRGGKEAVRSNTALGKLITQALSDTGIDTDAVQVVPVSDRALVEQMLQAQGLIDLIVPRGGADLIRYVRDNSRVPAVEGGVGVCHTYVDAAASVEMAVDIAHNAKVRRPYICNALDTLLVHAHAAPAFLPAIARRFAEAGVELRCDRRSIAILGCEDIPALKLSPARPEDYGQEFLALVAAVRCVDSLDDAIDHIAEHGSGHSEAIVTEDYSAAMRFLEEVDAAAVYVNASTQFTDGAQFGLGAEIGISTQKFHARGPLGLRELTSYKWVLLGRGHTRP